jgi:hypothetical protein
MLVSRVQPTNENSYHLRVDEHRIRGTAAAPAEAPNPCMAIEIHPALLPIPVGVAGSPSKLLERGLVGGVPQVHPYNNLSSAFAGDGLSRPDIP